MEILTVNATHFDEETTELVGWNTTTGYNHTYSPSEEVWYNSIL